MDDWRITLADVAIDEEEIEAVADVLRSGWLSMGPVTEQFEQAFAKFVDTEEAVAVTNGTTALHLAAVSLGIGPGDEVLCPALTFVATAAAMRHAGADVTLCDSLSLDDFSIDPEEIVRRAGPRTKAVVILHYGGYPADMAAIVAAARERNLVVIEDAAHALGAHLDGAACGTIGDAGCFSFFPNKNMTTGEGGMVIFSDPAATRRARELRSHAMTTLTWDRHRGHAAEYDVLGLGFNYRIDEIRAALGLTQLSRLADLNATRARLVARYRERLHGTPAFTIPSFGERGSSAFHLAPVLAASKEERDRLRAQLAERRIQTSIHYPAIHRFSHYRAPETTLPRAEQIADRVISLPLHSNLDGDDVDEVCAALVAETAARV